MFRESDRRLLVELLALTRAQTEGQALLLGEVHALRDAIQQNPEDPGKLLEAGIDSLLAYDPRKGREPG